MLGPKGEAAQKNAAWVLEWITRIEVRRRAPAPASFRRGTIKVAARPGGAHRLKWMKGIPPWHAVTYAYIEKSPPADAPGKQAYPNGPASREVSPVPHLLIRCEQVKKARPHNPNRLPTELRTPCSREAHSD